MANIQWRHDFVQGLQQAGEAQKALFLDFFKDG